MCIRDRFRAVLYVRTVTNQYLHIERNVYTPHRDSKYKTVTTILKLSGRPSMLMKWALAGLLGRGLVLVNPDVSSPPLQAIFSGKNVCQFFIKYRSTQAKKRHSQTTAKTFYHWRQPSTVRTKRLDLPTRDHGLTVQLMLTLTTVRTTSAKWSAAWIHQVQISKTLSHWTGFYCGSCLLYTSRCV